MKSNNGAFEPMDKEFKLPRPIELGDCPSLEEITKASIRENMKSNEMNKIKFLDVKPEIEI